MSIQSTTARTTEPGAARPGIGGTEVQLGREARRVLAAGILRALDEHRVTYGILRNPDRLLERGSGDLDLWVPSGSVTEALEVLSAEAASTGWSVAKRVERPYASSLYLYLAGPEPSVLTVDLFASIRWYMADIVPEGVIGANRIFADGHWVIDPRVGSLAATLHHFAWNGTAPKRYLEWFAATDDGVVQLPFVEVVRRLAAGGSVDLPRLRRSMLLRAWIRTMTTRPLSAVRDAGRLAASAWTAETGRWISFEGPRAAGYLALVERELKRNHFMIGRWGSVGRAPRSEAGRMLWYATSVAPKRRLGALLLSSGSPGRLRPDVRVDALEVGWLVRDRADPAPPASGTDPAGLVVALVRSLGAERGRRHAP